MMNIKLSQMITLAYQKDATETAQRVAQDTIHAVRAMEAQADTLGVNFAKGRTRVERSEGNDGYITIVWEYNA